MIRIGCKKIIQQLQPKLCSSNIRVQTTAPEKFEVFIDDKSVMVEPGTTVLQVGIQNIEHLILNLEVNFLLSLHNQLIIFMKCK